MSLTLNQKLHAEKLFCEKEDLTVKRNHNREELKTLKILLDAEQNENNHKLILQSYEIGEGLIEQQTYDLRKLTMSRIARDVGVGKPALNYYFISSNNNNASGKFAKDADFIARKVLGVKL